MLRLTQKDKFFQNRDMSLNRSPFPFRNTGFGISTILKCMIRSYSIF